MCFCVTINKSQGQSIKVAGIDLSTPCFSHGQLYVACSRVGSPENLYLLYEGNETHNVVYPAALISLGRWWEMIIVRGVTWQIFMQKFCFFAVLCVWLQCWLPHPWGTIPREGTRCRDLKAPCAKSWRRHQVPECGRRHHVPQCVCVWSESSSATNISAAAVLMVLCWLCCGVSGTRYLGGLFRGILALANCCAAAAFLLCK